MSTLGSNTKETPKIEHSYWLREKKLDPRSLHYGSSSGCGKMKLALMWHHLISVKFYWLPFNKNTLLHYESNLESKSRSIDWGVFWTSDWGNFWAWPFEILVIASPTSYMLTSSGFPLLNSSYFLESPLEWYAIFLQPPTSTGYFSNSTGSSITNNRFFPIIVLDPKFFGPRP